MRFVPLPLKTCARRFAFSADLLCERDDLDADAGRILGRDAGGGLRRAVMVLFLFVVMMLNIDIEAMRAGFWRHAPVAGVVGTLLAVALILILVNPKTDLAAFGLMKDIPADYNNIRDLGSRIYTDYLLPFELAAVLLLLGMVAAIALVHRKTFNPKRMDPADQVKVRADQGRMRLVKMEL